MAFDDIELRAILIFYSNTIYNQKQSILKTMRLCQ
jgi:hypothetical protein